MKYSSRSQKVGDASSILQNELVYKKVNEGINPIILSYGEAPFSLTEFDLGVLNSEAGAHYSYSAGVPEFCDDIVKLYKTEGLPSRLTRDNILVSCGSKIINYLITLAFVEDQDVALLHEPAWVSYQEHIKLSGGIVDFIPHEETLFDIENRLAENKRIKFLVINNPNNPRGYLYSEDEIRWAAKVCAKYEVILLIDESYSDFCGNDTFFSGANLVGDFKNVIILNSLSKNFSLSGWRLGYMIADPEIIKQVNKLNQHLITCAPTVLQLALVGKLDALRSHIKPQMVALSTKREMVEKLLIKHGFKFLTGSSTFYFFIDVSEYILDTKEFVLDLLDRRHVSIIPGGAYGASTGGFIRLSFAIEPLDKIDIGLKIIKEELENVEY